MASKLSVVEGEFVKKTEDDSTSVGDISSVLKSAGQAVLDTVGKIEIKTTAGTVNVNEPFKDDGSKPPLAARLLKPKVTVFSKDGKPLYSSAPYGEPVDHSGAVKIFALLGTLGIAAGVFGAGRASK